MRLRAGWKCPEIGFSRSFRASMGVYDGIRDFSMLQLPSSCFMQTSGMPTSEQLLRVMVKLPDLRLLCSLAEQWQDLSHSEPFSC